MNKLDGTSIPVKTKMIYADEKKDFALLSLLIDWTKFSEDNKILLKMIPPSQWRNTSELAEGDQVIYIGYPMFMGIGQKNYPLSRIGIISQLIKDNPFFLIDGFVQHGHSGSPVFVIRSDGNEYQRYLIGITASYPPEYADIYKEVKLIKESNKKVLINPGFTNVTSMDNIIPILKGKFGF